MGEVWIPEFQDLAALGSSNTMLRNTLSKKAAWHTTEAPSGHTKSGASYFDAMHRVLRNAKSEPHILIDPLTDEAGQYFPLNRSARALKSVNREGTICIQIEVVAYASKPFTRTWKPGPNWRALMRALRSWDIPDEFPGGPLMRTYGDSRTSRSASNWRHSGHFGHCQAPGNSHWDPGDIDTRALLAIGAPDSPAADAATTTTPTLEELLTMDLNDTVESRKASDIDPTTGRGKDVTVRELLQDIQAGTDLAARRQLEVLQRLDPLPALDRDLRWSSDVERTALASISTDTALIPDLTKSVQGLAAQTPATGDGAQ